MCQINGARRACMYGVLDQGGMHVHGVPDQWGIWGTTNNVITKWNSHMLSYIHSSEKELQRSHGL